MSQSEFQAELDGLPPPEELLEICASTLDKEVIDGIYELELDSSELLGCLWAELIEAGIDAEEFFRQKGVIR